MEAARQKKAAREEARAATGAGGRLQNARDGAAEVVLVCLGRGADVRAAAEAAADARDSSARPPAGHTSNTADEAGKEADATEDLGAAERGALRGEDYGSRGKSCASVDRELPVSQPKVQ